MMALPEILAAVRALHEHGLRVVLGVGRGVPEHHRVEVLGPEHREAAHHDGDHQDDQAVAQAGVRGRRPGLGEETIISSRYSTDHTSDNHHFKILIRSHLA